MEGTGGEGGGAAETPEEESGRIAPTLAHVGAEKHMHMYMDR